MPPLPRPALVRLLVAWLVVAAIGALALGSPGSQPLTETVVVVVLLLFAMVAAVTLRASLYLVAARAGLLRLDTRAPPHRLWRLAPRSLLGSIVVVEFGAALGVGVAALGAPRLGLVVGALASVGVAFAMGLFLVSRDLTRPTRPRKTSLLAWLLVDTALPVALLAAAAGAGIGWLRLGVLDVVSPSALSRHLALTLFAYALLLGPAGALKAGREKLAGLVIAPSPSRSLPGPFAVGGVLGVLVLALGPRLLPTVAIADVIAAKAALGFVVGGLLCGLGAWRGASAERRG